MGHVFLLPCKETFHLAPSFLNATPSMIYVVGLYLYPYPDSVQSRLIICPCPKPSVLRHLVANLPS